MRSADLPCCYGLRRGDRPPEIASGDLNSDGRTDLVVPSPIIIFMGNSNGVPTRTKLAAPDLPTNVGIGDFNRDGKMDLAIMHGEFSAAGVSIYIGDGSGGFGPPTNFPITTWDYLVVADFNNDGNADVFVSSDDAGSSQILLGNGNGGLSGGSTRSLSSSRGTSRGLIGLRKL